MKVLICEASPTMVLDLWCLLHEQGHTICGTAGSSTKCLDELDRTRPDLAIVDTDLGDGPTGLGLVEALAQRGVPSVLFSGEDWRVPATTSAKAVMRKPFDKHHLASAMARVERSSRLGASSH